MLDAFAEVDNIAVEINIMEHQAKAMMAMMQHGMFKDGKTIKDVLSSKTYQDLQNVLTKTPVPFADKMKPWAISQVLMISAAKSSGFDEQLGIDQFFIRKASRLNKPILEVEKPETQFKLFEAFNDLDQNLVMTETLKVLPEAADMFGNMMTAWRSGNLQQLSDISMSQATNTESEKRFYKKLLDDRNVQMANKIESYLNGGKSVLVIVGAAHYHGPQGVISMLKKRGYKISQM